MTSPSSASPARSPWRYLALVIVLSVPFWILGWIAPEPIPGLGLPLSALMFLAPLFAALVSTGRGQGRPGVGRLLRSLVDVRGMSPGWYLAAIGLLPLIYGISYGAHVAIGSEPASPQPGLLVFVVLAGVFLLTAACEEVGWTGCATDPLQARRGALVAALIIGGLWAGLHVVPDMQGGRSWDWIAGQRIFSVALRVLIVWVYNNTGRTLFAPTIVHATDNVSVFTLFPGEGSDGYEPAITAVVASAAAVVVSVVWGWRTLAGRRGEGHLRDHR